MRKLWEFLSGKKTTIGAILLFVATFFSEVIVGKWNATAEWIQPTIETLSWIGMALTGIGLGHKRIKGSAPIENKPQ